MILFLFPLIQIPPKPSKSPFYPFKPLLSLESLLSLQQRHETILLLKAFRFVKRPPPETHSLHVNQINFIVVRHEKMLWLAILPPVATSLLQSCKCFQCKIQRFIFPFRRNRFVMPNVLHGTAWNWQCDHHGPVGQSTACLRTPRDDIVALESQPFKMFDAQPFPLRLRDRPLEFHQCP